MVLALIGAVITINNFIHNVRQRKLENTFKTLNYLRLHITNQQINTFIKLFHANNPIGAPENEFHLDNGEIDTIETMFSEGGCGNGDIHNMIEVFNLISKSLNKRLLNEDLIWYEFGQIMRTCYRWTKYLENNHDKIFDTARKDGTSDNDHKKMVRYWRKHKKDMNEFFVEFNKYMERSSEKMLGKPIKHYTYIE